MPDLVIFALLRRKRSIGRISPFFVSWLGPERGVSLGVSESPGAKRVWLDAISTFTLRQQGLVTRGQFEWLGHNKLDVARSLATLMADMKLGSVVGTHAMTREIDVMLNVLDNEGELSRYLPDYEEETNPTPGAARLTDLYRFRRHVPLDAEEYWGAYLQLRPTIPPGNRKNVSRTDFPDFVLAGLSAARYHGLTTVIEDGAPTFLSTIEYLKSQAPFGIQVLSHGDEPVMLGQFRKSSMGLNVTTPLRTLNDLAREGFDDEVLADVAVGVTGESEKSINWLLRDAATKRGAANGVQLLSTLQRSAGKQFSVPSPQQGPSL